MKKVIKCEDDSEQSSTATKTNIAFGHMAYILRNVFVNNENTNTYTMKNQINDTTLMSVL